MATTKQPAAKEDREAILAYHLALTLDNYIQNAGSWLYVRLNLLDQMAACIWAMRGGKPEIQEALGRVQANISALRDRYMQAFDTDPYIVKERADFDRFMSEIYRIELRLIQQEKLISSRIMSRIIADHFGKGEEGN